MPVLNKIQQFWSGLTLDSGKHNGQFVLILEFINLVSRRLSQNFVLQEKLELREPPVKQELRETPVLMEKSVLQERRDQMVRPEQPVRPAIKELRAKLDLRERP